MPRFSKPEDLYQYSDELKKNLATSGVDQPIITVGMGTCGLAAGAGETYKAIHAELAKHNLKAIVRSVGCIGLCVKEPLVDIQLTGQPRITYTNITPAQVPRLIDEHVIQGQVVMEWAIGSIPTDW